MASQRNYYNYPANSLLESVMALSIISVCMYIAVMIYSSVFTAKTTARFYIEQNKSNELFFLYQMQQDTLVEKFKDENWTITEEPNNGLIKISAIYKNGMNLYTEKNYYIINE